MSTTTIPQLYRIWFTIIDPVLTLSAIAANLFAPADILESYTPSYVYPPSPETTLLLDTTAGFLACLLVLQVGLLRARPHDLTVWRAVQFGTLLVDLFMLGAVTRLLSTEGRTEWVRWRAQEWIVLGITACVAVLRTAFLAGVGVGVGGHRAGKKRA